MNESVDEERKDEKEGKDRPPQFPGRFAQSALVAIGRPTSNHFWSTSFSFSPYSSLRETRTLIPRFTTTQAGEERGRREGKERMYLYDCRIVESCTPATAAISLALFGCPHNAVANRMHAAAIVIGLLPAKIGRAHV